ncbi:MAG TPA: acyl-CoA dehydrogenase [Porticoccaceae bacterium]|jgi:alkylation response protein AidB-like acyl-CoA dehydrogenase|nr:acyl-CoA dehydrogenase [Gammaproteobacteria bacterium]HIL60150.1 acyl-CoA dehydrogenase [Porticoccaceae bacterium]
MDIKFSKEEQEFHDEIDEFLQRELPEGWADKPVTWPHDYASSGYQEQGDSDLAEAFLEKVIEKGWVKAFWDIGAERQAYSNMQQAIFDERMSYYRAPTMNSVTTGIVAPMLLRVGTKEQKEKWLPIIASGEATFWLGYSEPNAGSDLGSVRTSAVEDGDDYILNGQKCWSSGAHLTDYSWMIVRTDQEARKHQGLSFFIVDNKTPGIKMDPVINILGDHSFNNVFLDDVRISKDNLIGGKNRGFYNLMTALDYERICLVGIGGFKRMFEEIRDYVKATSHDGRPLSEKPSIRNKMARIATRIEVNYMLFWRTAEMLDRGEDPNVESSILKLTATELARDMAEIAMEILGPYGQITGNSERAPIRGLVSRGFLESISATIGAGTSEVMRNIIAQRGLGLPR